MYNNQEFFIDCDGIKVHAKLDFPMVQSDKMPVMVLIPGFTGHIEEDHIKAITATATEAGYVVLRSELYGHGQSEGTFINHHVLLWTCEAIRVIDYALNLEFASEVILAGHSQGGLTALLAGGIMHDKLKALVLLSPAISIPLDAKAGSMLGCDFDKNNIPESISSPDWTLGSNYVRVARMLPVDDAIKSFTNPVFIIHGTADEAVPYACIPPLANAYSNATFVTIEDEDHCYGHHMDQVLDRIKEFLNTIK